MSSAVWLIGEQIHSVMFARPAKEQRVKDASGSVQLSEARLGLGLGSDLSLLSCQISPFVSLLPDQLQLYLEQVSGACFVFLVTCSGSY